MLRDADWIAEHITVKFKITLARSTCLGHGNIIRINNAKFHFSHAQIATDLYER
jgi:hypothetical protein